jgi:hypothetical protein
MERAGVVEPGQPGIYAENKTGAAWFTLACKPQNKSHIFSGAIPSSSNASKMIPISGFPVARSSALNSAQPPLPDWMVLISSTIFERVESDIQCGILCGTILCRTWLPKHLPFGAGTTGDSGIGQSCHLATAVPRSAVVRGQNQVRHSTHKTGKSGWCSSF